ncbi:uncharacterized protein LOC117337658 isoform X2 [Pecten maximus]|uniref:uncharacterized protein LOC117337658 isoform X2 n=1 Tax=Pecten maximus TaxID=6579 RepID=UPI0014591724|nr:uncharacterized protein LOC117337658 isoform X2 [Pecten maximus]
MAECVTDRSDVSGDTIYTDRYVVPGELALSCQKRQLLSTSLSKSHEDVVRLLNWTNVSHTKAHWEDPEHEAILKETSEREILNSPDSFVGDFAYKQKWKPCFTSENIPKANEETNPTLTSDYTNMGSARSGYDVEAEISCIDLSEETTTTSSVQNCHTVKEFLRYDGDKLDTREVFYRDLSPCWSTSATSYDETTYSADTEETDNLYVTASEDDSELRGLASPVSLAGYARRDQIWEEDFVINYMTRATKEKIDKEYTKLLITQANEDIDKIHEIRIPVLLEEECLLESNDSLIDEPKTRVITEAMDSARSDVSCIELSKEEPTLRDIGEGHVVKEFLVRDEDNQGISNVVSDTEESDQWAVPTKHVTFELAESGSSSADDQVILSDIENDDDRSDITGNDVTSVQAFSDGDDSCVFDVDDQDVCLKKQDETGQSDPRPPDVQVASNTTPVLPFDDTNLNLDFVPRMSKLKKQGPRMGFKFLRRLNLKLAKVKQDLMTSSRLSKWLMP